VDASSWIAIVGIAVVLIIAAAGGFAALYLRLGGLGMIVKAVSETAIPELKTEVREIRTNDLHNLSEKLEKEGDRPWMQPPQA